MNIALTPHVLMPMDNDLNVLKEIYDKSEQKERICLLNKNLSAAEYKFIISNCRFGVFARTHASIAAYSSFVPSIVIGYSVKSKGIANDLEIGDYVLPIQSIDSDYCMQSMFKNLMDNEQKVKQVLADKIPFYKEQAKINV